MAGFHTKTFLKYDDYMTPKSAWFNIKDYIPKNKVIWESFYGDGKSGIYLEELGFNVIHKEVDFFKENLGDIIISNPPYTIKKEIFTRLKDLGKPFIMICPSSMINTLYIRNLFKDDIDFKIIIPRKRIQFIKDGKDLLGRCNFDTFYYCWKINLKEKIIWLE